MREVALAAARVTVIAMIALSVAAVVVVPLFDDGVELSVLAVVTVVGVAVSFESLRAVGRAHVDAWTRVVPLWGAAAPTEAFTVPDGIREWDALLAAASAGESRTRQRLVRRLAPLATPDTEPLLRQIATADPARLDVVMGEFVRRSEQRHD